MSAVRDDFVNYDRLNSYVTFLMFPQPKTSGAL
jgi:hypothetical protein